MDGLLMSDELFIAFVVVQSLLLAGCGYWAGYTRAMDDVFDKIADSAGESRG